LIITNENSGETDDKTRKNKVFDEEIHILGRDKIIVAVGVGAVMAASLGIHWHPKCIHVSVIHLYAPVY